MKIRTLKYQTKNQQAIRSLVAWETDYDAEVESSVTTIIRQVKELGDVALLDFTRQFDRYDVDSINQLKVSSLQMAGAWESISDEQRHALRVAKDRISAHAEQQKLSDWQIDTADGTLLGQKITPLDNAGLYVPGGQAAYPSTVLMNAIPAKVAGVARVVMTSPAMNGDINPLVLAAAFLCEIDEVYHIGGAQAIAALAYGTKSIAPVDIIVGPGNIYVATAKKQVFGKVAIDSIAGPSEVLIISDGSVDPHWVAADLFAQAEHDANAQAILVTDDSTHADAVIAAMDDLLEHMPRRDVIKTSLENRGAVILVNNIDEAVIVSDLIAPEHLQIFTADAMELARAIKHAGAIFIGASSCEVLGDYVAGPNHVLPTSGTARFSSPLGVYDFQKRTSLIRCSPKRSAELAGHAKILAESEGFYAHALSAKLRQHS